MDGHHYSMLKSLQGGHEENWEYISGAVDRGEIPRAAALSALEECLRRKIPDYQRNIDTRATKDPKDSKSGEGFGYWNGLLSEAVKTIRKIKDVKRGREPNIIYKGKSV